ncbi:MAG: hypothetical protein WCC87_06625 [Candidatus Korobacteraceae bacterium]
MRIQLDVDRQYVQLLNRLEEETGSRSHRELFNNALTLFDWAVKQRVEGRKIASLDEDEKSYRELQMPALEFAAQLTYARDVGADLRTARLRSA